NCEQIVGESNQWNVLEKSPPKSRKNCNKPLKKSGGGKHVQEQGWRGLRWGACGVRYGEKIFSRSI
ncbi:hypothetical protein, partial [Escherichia coli]|uniref:hypothetical protein n=1 Tax=Escherichia coli TaxID=562 RepID=UPI001BE4A9E2